VPQERLSQLRSLSDVRIRAFSVGRPRVTAADLCALLSDPKSGRLDALALEHGLLLPPHLEEPLELLGETMGFVVEACLALQVMGAAATAESLKGFVRKRGPAERRDGPAPAPRPAGPPPPQPLPPAVDRLLGATRGLWTPPASLRKISDLLEVAATPVDRVAGEIDRDPPLAGELLKAASLFNGTKMSTVKRALVTCGYPALRRLLGPAAVLARLGSPPPESAFDPDAFWSHSLLTAHAALLISRAAKLGEHETHFMAGLIHDLGRLVVARLLPARSKALREAEAGGTPRDAAEKATLGTGHAEIGACVAGRWGLAPAIVEAARHHHDDPATLEQQPIPREAAVVAALCSLSRDGSRIADWEPFLRLPASRFPEIRLQATRLAEDSLPLMRGSST
jgi:HD-like signal output (HDOD) protein